MFFRIALPLVFVLSSLIFFHHLIYEVNADLLEKHFLLMTEPSQPDCLYLMALGD